MAGSNAMKTAYPIFNGYAPKEGTKGMTFKFDFTVTPTMEIDMLLENTNGVMQFVQTIYADNSTNPNPLVVYVPATEQRLVIPAGAGGNWPLFCIDQVRIILASVVDPAATGSVILLNVPMPLTQWGPNQVNVNANVDPLVPSSNLLAWSGTIVTGGASQPGIPANVARKAWFIQNPPDAIEVLFVEFGDPASVTSLQLVPGEIYPPNGANVVFNGIINVMAATTGHAYIAREFFQ